jgi:hypothetical protein
VFGERYRVLSLLGSGAMGQVSRSRTRRTARERYYRLMDVQAPASAEAPWAYRFQAWPEGEVFRRLVDYEPDLAARAEADAKRLSGRLTRLLGRRA